MGTTTLLSFSTLVGCIAFGFVGGVSVVTKSHLDGWNFLEEGVTLHVIARNYDPLGNNVSDCLRTTTVLKNSENHTAKQVVTFMNHKAGEWMSIDQGLVAFPDENGEFNFMKTAEDSAGPQMSYKFLHTEKSCCVMEVTYAGAKRTVLQVEKESTKEDTDGRHCVLWVKQDALDARHASCEEYFLRNCVTKHVYTVYNRTECTSVRSHSPAEIRSEAIG
ncbi:hypothetical protein MRX96_001611 [Rhipicephalus microplus]|uniref:uncharacterized protein LOC119167951 n=1 Tax=Rhipicephalus microplus TaxID=6941 RepID=UPI0023765902